MSLWEKYTILDCKILQKFYNQKYIFLFKCEIIIIEI